MSRDNAAQTPWRKWLGRLGFAVLLLAVVFGVRFYQHSTLVEGAAPALRAPLLDGGAFDLAAQRGQPVLVYFWATWCPVCRLEQGSIESLVRDHRVVTVALQSGGSATVQKYRDDNGLRAPAINDPDGALAQAWGVRATPALFFIDANGTIRFREVGYTTEVGMRLRLWLIGV